MRLLDKDIETNINKKKCIPEEYSKIENRKRFILQYFE